MEFLALNARMKNSRLLEIIGRDGKVSSSVPFTWFQLDSIKKAITHGIAEILASIEWRLPSEKELFLGLGRSV